MYEEDFWKKSYLLRIVSKSEVVQVSASVMIVVHIATEEELTDNDTPVHACTGPFHSVWVCVRIRKEKTWSTWMKRTERELALIA